MSARGHIHLSPPPSLVSAYRSHTVYVGPLVVEEMKRIVRESEITK